MWKVIQLKEKTDDFEQIFMGISNRILKKKYHQIDRNLMNIFHNLTFILHSFFKNKIRIII